MPDAVSWLQDVPPAEMRRTVDALYRAHRLIADITDIDRLLETLLEESKGVAQAEGSSLLLFDSETEELFFHTALGESGDMAALMSAVRLKLGQGIAGAAASSRESINVKDALTDTRVFREADKQSQTETRSLLAVPLVDYRSGAPAAEPGSGGELIGVVELVNKQGGGAFTQADLRLMEMFASLAATAIVNARLIEANLEATRLAALGQAVAGLSHYTKNIIAGMSGSVDLINEGLRDDKIDFLKRSWPILQRSIKRISIFVEDMLAYSKPREPRLSEVCVRELINDVQSTFLGLMLRKNITMTVHVDTDLVNFAVDPDGIHRALLNLLANAADAVPQEGGAVAMTASSSDGNVYLEVADNGPGIPVEERSKILAPFYSTKGAKGTGLGLAVTHKIVQEHGGQLEIADAPEGGALFRVCLPGAARTPGPPCEPGELDFII